MNGFWRIDPLNSIPYNIEFKYISSHMLLIRIDFRDESIHVFLIDPILYCIYALF